MKAEVGQIWVDKHRRRSGRERLVKIISITDDYISLMTTNPPPNITARCTNIRANRLRSEFRFVNPAAETFESAVAQ